MDHWIYYSTIMATLLIAYTLVLRQTLYVASTAHPALRTFQGLFSFAIVAGIWGTFYLTEQSLQGQDVSGFRWVPFVTAINMLVGIIGPFAFTSVALAAGDSVAWLTTRNPMPFLRWALGRYEPRRRRPISKKQRAMVLRFAEQYEKAIADRERGRASLAHLTRTEDSRLANAQRISRLTKYLEEMDEWITAWQPPRSPLSSEGQPDVSVAETFRRMDETRAEHQSLLRKLYLTEREMVASRYEMRKITIRRANFLAVLSMYDHDGRLQSQLARPPAQTLPVDARLRRLKNRNRKRLSQRR
ncbi:hypothetical protein [Ornithinimicrobium cerasi]|uniref:hypothetical protein n=1 Tax=Ornithinimicrobium cerasi TaxID=2248773 RepID=UPI0013795E63|nr:hypothetical protein [Ornithinimicrobium cerasi]